MCTRNRMLLTSMLEYSKLQVQRFHVQVRVSVLMRSNPSVSDANGTREHQLGAQLAQWARPQSARTLLSAAAAASDRCTGSGQMCRSSKETNHAKASEEGLLPTPGAGQRAGAGRAAQRAREQNTCPQWNQSSQFIEGLRTSKSYLI